jgi:hypothetical protein
VASGHGAEPGQHGRDNVASFMLYRNYMTSSEFPEEINVLNRAKCFLTEQWEHCLDDGYVAAHYRAKVTFMVEACELLRTLRGSQLHVEHIDAVGSPHTIPVRRSVQSNDKIRRYVCFLKAHVHFVFLARISR